MNVTASYDMAFQFSQGALQGVINSQHVARILVNRLVRIVDGRRVDIVVNSPRVILEDAHDPEQAILESYVFYNRRDPTKAHDLGTSAVFRVRVRLNVTIGGQNPAPLHSASQLHIDSTQTSIDDIFLETAFAHNDQLFPQVQHVSMDSPPDKLQELSIKSVKSGVETDFVTEAKATLLSLIHECTTRRFPLPLLGSGDLRIGSAAFKFMNNQAANCLTIGLNENCGTHGSRAGLVQSFAKQDWALAFRGDYFIDKVNRALLAQYPLPYQIIRKCTVEAKWPASGCLNWTTIKLVALSLALRDGYMELTGTLRITNSGPLIPDASPSFSARIDLEVTESGDCRTVISDVLVSLNDWRMDAIDFLSRDSLSSAIKKAVESAGLSTSWGDVSGVVTSASLNKLAGVDGAADLQLTLQLRSVEVTMTEVVAHGVLIAPKCREEPVADFSFAVIERTSQDTLLVFFDAAQSIAPGGTITSYEWFHSYGDWQRFAGSQRRFLNRIEFRLMKAGPPQTAQLIVTDDCGRTATTTHVVIEGNEIHFEVAERFHIPPLPEYEDIVSILSSKYGAPIAHTMSVANISIRRVEDVFGLPLFADAHDLYRGQEVSVERGMIGARKYADVTVDPGACEVKQPFSMELRTIPVSELEIVLTSDATRTVIPLKSMWGSLALPGCTVKLQLKDGSTVAMRADANGVTTFVVDVEKCFSTHRKSGEDDNTYWTTALVAIASLPDYVDGHVQVRLTRANLRMLLADELASEADKLKGHFLKSLRAVNIPSWSAARQLSAQQKSALIRGSLAVNQIYKLAYLLRIGTPTIEVLAEAGVGDTMMAGGGVRQAMLALGRLVEVCAGELHTPRS